jgi:hypothetical protein
MAICSCGLPACCCQPTVAGGFIYADLRGELSTHLDPQALFTQSSPGLPLLQAFPFPSTLKEVTLHLLSQAVVFVYSSRGKWVFSSLSCGVFLPPLLLQAFLLLFAGRVPPLLPSQAQLVYLQFCEGFPSPLLCTQGAPLSLLHVFIILIAYYSVSLFFPGWGSVCPGDYADLAQGCLWEYCILLSSPYGLRLPRPAGHWCLAVARGPSWFLCLT